MITQKAREAARAIINNSELQYAEERIQRLMDAAEQRGREQAAVIADEQETVAHNGHRHYDEKEQRAFWQGAKWSAKQIAAAIRNAKEAKDG